MYKNAVAKPTQREHTDRYTIQVTHETVIFAMQHTHVCNNSLGAGTALQYSSGLRGSWTDGKTFRA
jgi:hypothetical protein